MVFELATNKLQPARAVSFQGRMLVLAKGKFGPRGSIIKYTMGAGSSRNLLDSALPTLPPQVSIYIFLN